MRRVLALVLAALLVTAGAPAAAGNDGDSARQAVGLSVDGVDYQTGLDQPLFDPTVRWVPGDVRGSTFWVRNQAAESGDLTMDLLVPGRGNLFVSGHLSVTARAGDGPWHTVTHGESMRLLTHKDFPAEAEALVTVRVALAPEAANGTMVLATDLDFRVTLTDARATAPGTGPDGADGGGPGGLLPGTGLSASWWAVVRLGLLLLMAGLFLLFLSRSLDQSSTGNPHSTGETR